MADPSAPDPAVAGTPVPELPRDERLVPLLPLLHVAWSDGVLSAEEMDFLRARLAELPWLDANARAALEGWLDPASPPGPEALQALLRRVRGAAEGLEPDERRSLARLGLALARAGRAPEPGEWQGEPGREVLDALHEVEEILGVAGAEAGRELLRPALPGEGAEAGAPVLAPLPAYEASFDVDALARFLDGGYREDRERVRALLSEPVFALEHGLDPAEHRERVWAWVRRLADEGLGAVGYPEAYGGTGDLGRAVAVFQTLAHHDLSLLVKFGVQFGLFGLSVLQLGTEKHHRRYLAAIGRGELPGCFAMSETGHGSNVREICTTADYDPETEAFVVNTPGPRARKDWIGNAALHGRMATVFAQLRVGEDHHGVHAFLVPIRDENGAVLPGIAVEDCGLKEGLNGVDNGRLSFDRVRVPRENLLDRFGSVSADGRYTSPIRGASKRFFTMLGTLVTGRISIAAASVSAAETGLAITVRYGDRRRQFGPAGGPEVPILEYRAYQRRLLPRLAASYGLRFAVEDLVRRQGEAEGGERRAVEGRAAGLKAYASRHAVETLQACRELCGGQGYLAENRLGALMADTDVFTTFEGANPVLLQLVAKGLLTGYREEFSELRLWGVVKQVAGIALSAVAEKNPVASRRTDPEHLRDAAFHDDAFRYREERLLRSAALRLRGRIQEGVDTFRAMNEVQDHLLTLARAHVERIVHDAFRAGVERAAEIGPDEAAALERLRALWALWRLESDRGWYLESGYIEGRKSKAIREQVNALVPEVRADARGLVDAFGIPDPVLAAPIALEV